MTIDRITPIKRLNQFEKPVDYFEHNGELYPIYYSDFDDNGIRKSYLYELNSDQFDIIIQWYANELFFIDTYIELILRTYINMELNEELAIKASV